MNFLIPIAKSSKKIKSVVHKSLIKFNNEETLLEFQINKIVSATKNLVIKKIIINLIVDEYENEISSLCEKINQQIPINIHLNILIIRNKTLAEAIKEAFRLLKYKDSILIMGDIVFNEECIAALLHNKISTFLTDGKNLFAKNEIGLWANNGEVNNFSYSLPDKWIQMCYLNSEFIRNYSALCTDKMLVHEVFNKVLTITSSFLGQSNNAKAIEIDKPKDIRMAKQVFL